VNRHTERTISVSYDEHLLKRAARRYWLRSMAIPLFLLAITLLFAAVVSRSELPTIVTPVAWTVSGTIMIGLIYSYRQGMSVATRFAASMDDTTVTLRFSEHGMAVASEMGCGESPWRAYQCIWRYDDMWMIVSWQRYVIVPTDQQDDELRDIIVRGMANRHRREPVCRKCGYDLRGQIAPRCPECGEPFDIDLLEAERKV